MTSEFAFGAQTVTIVFPPSARNFTPAPNVERETRMQPPYRCGGDLSRRGAMSAPSLTRAPVTREKWENEP